MNRHRHRLSIRAYLKVSSYAHGGERVITHEIEQAAYNDERSRRPHQCGY